MVANWKEYELGDLIQFKNGKKRPKENGAIPVYGGNGILDYVEKSNFTNCIIIGRVGAYCGSVYYSENDCWVSDNAIAALPTEKMDVIFSYYLLKSLNLNNMRIGSSQPLLTQGILNKICVSVPELDEQRRIGDTLWQLDQLIKTNGNIINNMNSQAKAYFEKIFLLSGPKEGWKKGTFSELITSTLGGDWGKDAETGNYTEQVYCVRGADIPEVNVGNIGKMPLRFILKKNFDNKRLVPGDLVVEISGGSPTQSTGRIAAISQALLDRYDRGMVCTNFCRAIKPKRGYSMFIYYYWLYLYEKNRFFAYENGTTGIKNLDINGFLESEEIVIPSEGDLGQFNSYCASAFENIFSLGLQNEKLSSLRELLIKKMIVNGGKGE